MGKIVVTSFGGGRVVVVVVVDEIPVFRSFPFFVTNSFSGLMRSFWEMDTAIVLELFIHG